jgi:hypothetical protein
VGIDHGTVAENGSVNRQEWTLKRHRAVEKQQPPAPLSVGYKIVAVSLYSREVAALDYLVTQLGRAGPRANRSRAAGYAVKKIADMWKALEPSEPKATAE